MTAAITAAEVASNSAVETATVEVKADRNAGFKAEIKKQTIGVEIEFTGILTAQIIITTTAAIRFAVCTRSLARARLKRAK